MSRKTTYNQLCVICKTHSEVSASWHAYNRHTCMSKVCVNVFNALPFEIKFHFNAIGDNNQEWIDRGLYYSRESDRYDEDENSIDSIDILSSSPVEYKYGQYKERAEVEELRFSYWMDYSEFIFSNYKFFKPHDKHKTLPSYWHVVLCNEIILKPDEGEIKKTIYELINLERAILISKDVIRVCKANDINTFFCVQKPYLGPQIQRTIKPKYIYEQQRKTSVNSTCTN